MSQHSEQQPVYNGRWTQQQHQLFLYGLQLHGRNWKKIQELIKSRTPTQVRSHAQKYFQKNKESKKLQVQRVQLTKEEVQTSEKDLPEITNCKNTFSYFFGEIVTKLRSNENFNFFQDLIDQNKLSNCLDPKNTELNKFVKIQKYQKQD